MNTALSSTLENAAPSTKTWNLDPSHTAVEFAVKHLMIATVKGRFSGVTGAVTLDSEHPDPDASTVDATVDVATIDTRDERRDTHLRSADFLDAARWPSMRFVGKRIEGDVTRRFKLIGDLTIRDTTREVALDVTNEGRVTDPWGGDRMGFTATGRLNRGDYGLTWNVALEAGGVLVGEDVRITIQTELVRQN